MGVNEISATIHFGRRPRLGGSQERASEACWAPNTDVYLCETGLVIKVELAGMQREDLELTVDGNRLHITGLRRDRCRPSQCRFVVMEINYGHFESYIDLPPGYDLAAAKAAYQNGFLRVDVPLLSAAPSRPFSVPVESVDS